MELFFVVRPLERIVGAYIVDVAVGHCVSYFSDILSITPSVYRRLLFLLSVLRSFMEITSPWKYP